MICSQMLVGICFWYILELKQHVVVQPACVCPRPVRFELDQDHNIVPGPGGDHGVNVILSTL